MFQEPYFQFAAASSSSFFLPPKIPRLLKSNHHLKAIFMLIFEAASLPSAGGNCRRRPKSEDGPFGGETPHCPQPWGEEGGGGNNRAARSKGKREREKTHRVQHVSGVSGRHAEAGSGLDDGRRREAHHHRADVPLQHLPTERPEKKEQGDSS